jgi:two-component system, HptB-dependent secretion and biofilm response regulator
MAKRPCASSRAEYVDFVFMDVMMPVLDGYEAVRRIKELCRQKGRFCPVLFVTAASDDRALADCIACGGDDFLTKPFNHTIMRAKMRALERTSRSLRAGAAAEG